MRSQEFFASVSTDARAHHRVRCAVRDHENSEQLEKLQITVLKPLIESQCDHGWKLFEALNTLMEQNKAKDQISK